MERSQLLYVVATAKHGSITKAAEELYISQPSLSNQIIKLENELGIKLFERKRQRMELTQAGTAFIEYARGILNSFKKLEQLMGEYASMNKGSITIGILPITDSMKILDYLSEFQRKFPSLEIIVRETGSSALVELMLKKEIDVAFAILSDEMLKKLKEEFDVFKIRKDKITVVMNSKHRLANKESIDLKDLSNEKFIFSNDNFQFPRIVTGYMDSMQIPYTISCRCSQLETTFSMVAHNFGITLCSELTTGKNLTEGRYKDLNLKSIVLTPAIERTIYMLSPKNAGYHPTIDNFIKFMKEQYKMKISR